MAIRFGFERDPTKGEQIVEAEPALWPQSEAENEHAPTPLIAHV